jgi:hypothetical protein
MNSIQAFRSPTGGVRLLFQGQAAHLISTLWNHDEETIIKNLPSPVQAKESKVLGENLEEDWREYVAPGIADETKTLFDCLEEGFGELSKGVYYWDVSLDRLMEAAMITNHARMKFCIPKTDEETFYVTGDIIPPAQNNADFSKYQLFTALNDFFIDLHLKLSAG